MLLPVRVVGDESCGIAISKGEETARGATTGLIGVWLIAMKRAMDDAEGGGGMAGGG